ncbi:MAG: hypothetical protein QOI47_1434, partial [Actinomycetota bacterium]|nr:hypothetical protein [Actinomycetota bacterium]
LRTAPAEITGWVAVSASKLTAYDRRRLRWLRAYCPIDVLARTVLVYRFDSPPDRTIAGPDAPARECSGRSFSVLAAGTSPVTAARATGTPS